MSTSVLVPIAICVVLPVMIVWIVFRTIMNADNKRAQVLTEAIKSNNGIDADRLAEAMTKKTRTPREILNLRLLRGCIFSLTGLAMMIAPCIFDMFDLFAWPQSIGLILTAIGISYLVVYFVTKRQTEEA